MPLNWPSWLSFTLRPADSWRTINESPKKRQHHITTRALDKLMYKRTGILGVSKSIVLAIVVAMAAPSFAASVKGTSPAGNEVDIEITKTPALKYPRRAERLGVEGYVIVSFDLSEEGELIDLRVLESEPRLMFDKSALKFVKGMKFAVPEEDGTEVSARDVSFRVQFKLQR